MVPPSSKTKPNHAVEKLRTTRITVRKRLYTLKEAAEYLGRSEWGMRELAWAGKILVVKLEGGRKIFFDIEDLDDFIRQNKSTYL
jgi:excisionase family DNA binding protein